MHTRILDFGTVLKDRLMSLDQPIAQQGIHTRGYKKPMLCLLSIPITGPSASRYDHRHGLPASKFLSKPPDSPLRRRNHHASESHRRHDPLFGEPPRQHPSFPFWCCHAPLMWSSSFKTQPNASSSLPLTTTTTTPRHHR
jgi:hypothetical protein